MRCGLPCGGLPCSAMLKVVPSPLGRILLFKCVFKVFGWLQIRRNWIVNRKTSRDNILLPVKGTIDDNWYTKGVGNANI